MPRWSSRRERRPNSVPESRPVLRTDDRPEFRETVSSANLATQMLEAAQAQAAGLARGAQFGIDIPGGFSHVHNMEMMLSLSDRAYDCGLEIVVQFNNTVTFRKL